MSRRFIKFEISERIRRALHRKIRLNLTYFEHRYTVYFRCESSDKWHGPGTVIGTNSKILFLNT